MRTVFPPHDVEVRRCRFILFLLAILPRRLAALSALAALTWAAPSPAQTIYSVTNTGDSGLGSLAQAVDDLNASGAAGTIRFDAGSSGSILLSSGLTLTQEASLLNESGGAVAVSLSGASNITALTAASLGTLGGASGLAIEAAAAGGSNAYGIFSGDSLTIASIAETGSVTATAGTSSAFGVYTSGNIGIVGAMAGDISAMAITGSSAYGFYCSYGLISIGSMASTGNITATAGTSNANGIRANGVTITGEMAGGITATSGSNAIGMQAASGSISIGSMASTGNITTTAGTSGSTGMGATVNVGIAGVMAGDIAATATSGATAYGIFSGSSITLGSMAATGSITATAGTNNAYGVRTGIASITGEMAGDIAATATSGANAFGILGTSLTIGSMAATGSIAATAGTNNANGIRAATVTITGEMAGDIAATAGSGSTAYGIYSTGPWVTIGSIATTGSITATAGADTAYGVSAAGNVTISGGMAGTITATAGTHTALGIWSAGTLTVGSAAAPLSGTVSARADGLAVAVAANGAMNLYVTGTLSGVAASGSGEGYAIRAGTADGSGGWTTGSADNTVTLATGATLVGKVDLGTGTNTVNLIGTGSADNLFIGVDSLAAGDGATATAWTLNPAAANASTYGSATVNSLASLTVNENVTVTGDIVDNGTLTFDLASDSSYAGVISGTGNLVKTGSATLTLTGATTYTGTTLVAEGDLHITQTLNSRSIGIFSGATLDLGQDYTTQDYAMVNGALIVPELTVAQGAILYGSGTIQGDVTGNGTISPGNSPGTLTILGDLTLNAGSTLFMEITPSANDLLAVSGTTTILGGTLSVAVSQGLYTSGQIFTLVTSTGGITGYFDAVSVDCSSPFLRFTIDADADSIQATVSRQSYTIAGTSRNSMGAAIGLTGATSLATPSMRVLLGTIDFMEIGDVARGLRQMSPEPYSALDETAFSGMRLFSDTIRDRAYARRSGGETLLTAVSAGNIGRLTQLASAAGVSDAGSGLNAKGTGMGMALFVKPVGQYQSVDNGHNRTGFQSWQYGVMAGGDAHITENFLAGFQVGWVHSDLRFRDDATSTGFSDAFLGGVYASATAGGFYADGLVQAGAAVNQLDRRIEFGSISRQPTGKYTAFVFGASLSTGYDWTFGNWTAGPVATLDYGYVSNPGFAESDPDLGLTVGGFTGNSLKTGLGAKVSGTFTAGETVVAPDLSLRWGHEFLNDSRTISARYNGSPTSGFTSRTGEPARDSLLVDAGVSFGVSESTKLYVRYSGQFLARGTHSQAGAVGVRYEF